MAVRPVKPWALNSYVVEVGGTPTVAAFGPLAGGAIIQNPLNAQDQNVPIPETLFISMTGAAGLLETSTTFPIEPGQFFFVPAGCVNDISINASTSGHRFSGVAIRETSEYTPSEGDFPPPGPTTLLAVIPAYLYQQYNDDEDLQAFVDALNALYQSYVTWFATVMLPVYTNPMVNTDLLDWVAQGLYGMSRPALPSGRSQNIGAINTFALNTWVINEEEIIGPPDYYITTDDIFRRILTWHLWKGDGKIFDIRWLKRRVKRFLTGTDGTAGNTEQTYDVSVTFGVGNQVNINLQSTRRFAIGGAVIGAGQFNTFMPNEFDTTAVSVPVSPYVTIFKAAVEAGVLELPFQFDWIVNID